MNLFGQTRTTIKARHALIAPDGHVPSEFPDWDGVVTHVILSPAMGAGLTQLLIHFGNDNATHGQASFPSDPHEHALYIENGPVTATYGTETVELDTGGYLFVPSETPLELSAPAGSRATVFRKIYEPHESVEAPPAVHGNAADVVGEPFLGNERALLKTLLPIDPRYDLAINIFTYEPGATLPFVETHIMEHGLMMLSGQGIYRLEDDYYPVMEGDAIWMAPYCPQWFVAMGDVPASYLYYKDIHRLP